MLTEQCVACGAEVPLSDAVHMLVNPKDDDVGVTDGYICRSCYVERVEPILAGVGDEGAVDEGGDGEGDEGEPDGAGDRRREQAPAGDVPEESEGGDRPAEGV